MKEYKHDELKNGELYFCVHNGRVYHLVATKDSNATFFDFHSHTIYGVEDDSMFPAFECTLIYTL